MANGSPSLAARSRATPAMLQASGRLASTATSKTTSGTIPMASTSRRPGTAPFEPPEPPALSAPSSTRIPSWSSDSPSSRPEHSMPLEVTPFIVRRPISKSPGSTAPTGARGTKSPTSKFHAPHTTSTGSPPALTTTRRIRSAPSMGAISSTRATTTSPSPSPTRSMPSTTKPRSSRVAARSAGSPSNGAKSRSQDRGTRTSVLSELAQEADVVLDQGAHVGNPMPHLGAAIDAEAEGETGPPVSVDPHRVEHGRVDHAAPTELDPARL